MAARRRLDRKTEDRRPVVTDDFIYDDPDSPVSSETLGEPASDTPEEAIRKLRRRSAESGPDGEPAAASHEDESEADASSAGR